MEPAEVLARAQEFDALKSQARTCVSLLRKIHDDHLCARERGADWHQKGWRLFTAVRSAERRLDRIECLAEEWWQGDRWRESLREVSAHDERSRSPIVLS